jgi:hypothetical protein
MNPRRGNDVGGEEVARLPRVFLALIVRPGIHLHVCPRVTVGKNCVIYGDQSVQFVHDGQQGQDVEHALASAHVAQTLGAEIEMASING